MEPKVSDLLKLQSNTFQIRDTGDMPNLSQVFTGGNGTYINEFNLFLAYFNAIPNLIHEERVNCKKAHKWLLKFYESEIKDVYFDRRCLTKRSKKLEFDDIFYILFDDLIIDFDTNCSSVKFLFRKTDYARVEAVIKGIKRFKKRNKKKEPKISLLIDTSRGIDAKSFEIIKPQMSIEDNYNDDFMQTHQTIAKRLSKNNDKGLVILHGKSGTGKTNYIRYLISLIKKDVIFLPPNMASCITNPDLIYVLINKPNSILVIEDAENIVIDREKDVYSPVSALLNISDGLLSDCLNIQVICSFNTDLTKVDNAMLRKGRLIANYEFKELTQAKSQALSEKLGFSSKITEPMTLTDIYNQEEEGFQQPQKKNAIGFKACEAN